MKNARKANLRQRLFCEYYCGKAEGNVSTAAIMAGYSENYAYKQGYKLLEKQGVKDYIQEINQQCTSENIATIEEIQRFWTKTMENKTLDIRDRLKASELLAKCKGMFNTEW